MAAEKDESKVKKSRSFKRIRGFLRGESRKERKAKKEAELAKKKAAALKKKSAPSTSAARSSNKAGADDESTIYNVDVDERSIATRQSDMPTKAEASAASLKKKAYMLKVVLLLMDPKTRRFELLQLEFDSAKALVSDVLAQIPVSVTEEVLRKQTYTGICGNDGEPMPPTKLLSTFCKGNEVLVAIPTGVPASECARLAKPILGDDKVISMLASSGIDTKVWKEESMKKPEIKSREQQQLPTPTAVEPEAKPEAAAAATTTSSSDGGGGGGSSWFFMIVVFAVLLQVFHIYISAPIKPGHTVSPGIWLSKCGVLALLPSCENEYFFLDKDGRATVYNDKHQVAWEMQGAVCPENAEDCKPGMVVEEDGSIVIGGKKVNGVVLKSKEASLSPWPFEQQPKVKLFKKY